MKRLLAVVVLVGVSGVSGALLRAQVPPQLPPQTPLDPRVLEWDKGPARIDVSKYPPEMQARYKIFQATCSKCHTLARPINSDFVLEDDWERYIKMMMRRGRGTIPSADALQIWEFLVFDSKMRKKELYERRMAERRP